MVFALAATLAPRHPTYSTISPQKLQAERNAGKRVILVDVREPEEYAEGHLPGAVNIPLHQLSSEQLVQYAGADYVVPYCLKDFRGFEGARLALQGGLDNVYLLEGYGLASWKNAGLPLEGGKP